MSNKRTVIGNFIHTTWGNLNVRCRNGLYRKSSAKNKAYNEVDILFSRDEFKIFCFKNKDLIESLNRPSIDRLDKVKHYTLDNIAIIELAENIRKDKTVFINGSGTCFSCKQILPEEVFINDKRKMNGKSNICKPCEAIRIKERNFRLYKKAVF